MKTFLVLSALVALSAAETYRAAYDYIDVEAVISNPESLKGFTLCYLDLDECNVVAQTFKNVLGEAIEQACAKCTQAQKHMFNRYLTALEEIFPDDYISLQEKYDPEDRYLEVLRAAIAND